MGTFRDTYFVLQKSTKPQNKHFGVQKTCTELCRIVDVWIQVRFPALFLEMSTVKTLKKNETLGNLLNNKWKTWMIRAASKFEISWPQSRLGNLHCLELPIQRQEYASLCRAQGTVAWSTGKVAVNFVNFVLWNVLSLSTQLNFLKKFYSLPKFKIE